MQKSGRGSGSFEFFGFGNLVYGGYWKKKSIFKICSQIQFLE
jgi:hypothetical protein